MDAKSLLLPAVLSCTIAWTPKAYYYLQFYHVPLHALLRFSTGFTLFLHDARKKGANRATAYLARGRPAPWRCPDAGHIVLVLSRPCPPTVPRFPPCLCPRQIRPR
jgi:hypothetical protein